jgi:hypothetical protein
VSTANACGDFTWPGVCGRRLRPAPRRPWPESFRPDRGPPATVVGLMGSLIKKRRKRMRKKKHKKMLKRTRFQRRAKGK